MIANDIRFAVGYARRSTDLQERSLPDQKVAVERWQDFTGGVAVLEGDGRTFNEVAQDETRACA